MSTLYEKGERVRVRTITSEMDAIIVAEPVYVSGWSSFGRSVWKALTVPWGRPNDTPVERRILGRRESP